ncbi:MAG: pyridoxal-phosphate dependent enzyme, partial [Paraburkholderia nemoris]
MQALPAPTFDDVLDAAARLNGVAHRTPVLTSSTFNERTGASVFFKCENFQRMGAFKFRGAYNAISHFDAEQRKAGVLT